ncbi:hypothetical protein MD484_g8081, partial [Candolleomyces efflorescens]
MDEHSYKLLQSALRVTHNTRYSEGAALTFLLCDIASTFSDEVKFIWSKKWTFTKVMYLIARYYGLLLAIAMVVRESLSKGEAQFCRDCQLMLISFHKSFMSMIGSKFYVAVIDIICITRVFGLYGHNRKIFALLAVTSIVDVAVGLFCVRQVTLFPGPVPPKNELSKRYGCPFLLDPVSKEMVRWYIVTWILTLGNATVFLLFTLYKLKDSMKDEFGNARFNILKDRSLISPFLVAFVRDGALCFLLIAGEDVRLSSHLASS